MKKERKKICLKNYLWIYSKKRWQTVYFWCFLAEMLMESLFFTFFLNSSHLKFNIVQFNSLFNFAFCVQKYIFLFLFLKINNEKSVFFYLWKLEFNNFFFLLSGFNKNSLFNPLLFCDTANRIDIKRRH